MSMDSMMHELLAITSRELVKNGEHRNMDNPIEVRSYLIGCAISEQVVNITKRCTEEDYETMVQLLDVLEAKVASYEKGER